MTAIHRAPVSSNDRAYQTPSVPTSPTTSWVKSLAGKPVTAMLAGKPRLVTVVKSGEIFTICGPPGRPELMNP